jgi:hypothetical protein
LPQYNYSILQRYIIYFEKQVSVGNFPVSVAIFLVSVTKGAILRHKKTGISSWSISGGSVFGNKKGRSILALKVISRKLKNAGFLLIPSYNMLI